MPTVDELLLAHKKRLVRPYRRPRLLMLVVCLLLGAQLVYRTALLARLVDPPDQSTPMALVYLDLTTAIAFLLWLAAVRRNLDPLGSTEYPLARGVLTIGWFMPIFNLFHGYRVLRQVWIESQPGVLVIDGQLIPRRARLVSWWWAAFVPQLAFQLLFIKDLFFSRMISGLDDSVSFEDWHRTSPTYLVLRVLSIAAAGLAVAMVLGIDRRQEAQHQHLVAAAQPPPLPDRPF